MFEVVFSFPWMILHSVNELIFIYFSFPCQKRRVCIPNFLLLLFHSFTHYCLNELKCTYFSFPVAEVQNLHAQFSSFTLLFIHSFFSKWIKHHVGSWRRNVPAPKRPRRIVQLFFWSRIGHAETATPNRLCRNVPFPDFWGQWSQKCQFDCITNIHFSLSHSFLPYPFIPTWRHL